VLRTLTTRLKLDTLKGTISLETLVPPATPAVPTRVQVTPAFVEISYGVHTLRLTPAGIVLNNGALVVV
jgi:hypothetical protein